MASRVSEAPNVKRLSLKFLQVLPHSPHPCTVPSMLSLLFKGKAPEMRQGRCHSIGRSLVLGFSSVNEAQ